MRTLIALLLAGVAAAAPAAPQPDALQQFVQKVETLSARFEQVQKDEKGVVLQSSSGRLWLARPGRFHWAYEKPFQQQIICDGKTLWQYDPDLAQVMVRPAGQTLQGTPAQLLTDRVALDKHFTVKGLGNDAGAQRVLLTPKSPDSDFRAIEIWLKDAAPQRMRFEDPLGGTSEIIFREVRTNAPIEPAQFRFEVPKGTEVISAQ